MKLRTLLVVIAVVSTAAFTFFVLRKPTRQVTTVISKPQSDAPMSVDARKSIAENFGRIPLHFEVNRGQVDSSVRFLSRGNNHALFLKQNEAHLVLPEKSQSSSEKRHADASTSLNLKLVNANEAPAVEGVDELEGRANYYLGDDPGKWRQDVQTFKKVKYTSVYDGVDMVYYGNQRQLEYDFIVAPNADPNVIAMKFENTRDIKIDKSGDLIMSVNNKRVRQQAPVVYQEIAGNKTVIQAGYVLRDGKLKGEHEVGFRIGEYDHSKPLVIDPVIVFSTYLGGSAGDDLFTFEVGFGITVDSSGNIYVGGTTPSFDFPTQTPHQAAQAGVTDGFLTKLNPTGTALLYSTYFGGNDDDRIISISIGASNEMIVAGSTWSTNFPLITPFQAMNRGLNDCFISRFTSAGVLNYSTYLGGSGQELSNFIKSVSSDVVAFAGSTSSGDFPTANALQPTFGGFQDFFAGKLNITTNTMLFSTFYGGVATESMIFTSAAMDPAGNIYLSGVSNSFNYPVTANAYQLENGGSDDAVVTKINSAGTSVIYSTFIGGNLVDSADALAVDPQGNAYITGFTRSANFPLKNAAQPVLHDPDAFVTKVNPTGTDLVFSTFLGGQNLERGSGIAADAGGNCYVTGRSNSGDFPAKRSLRPPRGLDDVFISRYNRDGALLFSTLLGGSGNDYGFGIAADNSNNVLVTGRATRNFFVTAGAYQTTIGGQADAFITKINTSVRKVKSDFDGDGKSDVAVFRPSQAVWYLLQTASGYRNFTFGIPSDEIVPGDYDADGITDIAVFRPSAGAWYILNSRTNTLRSLYWGVNGDKPVQGDYDGDDKTDVAVYRPVGGVWLIIRSSNNSLLTQVFGGSPDDKPVPADYDGDGVTDIAVYTPGTGIWAINGTSKGIITQRFGLSTDKPTPADYDGDGYDDIAVYRESQGVWYSVRSGSDNALSVVKWGVSGDIPTPADYDGDGKEDYAVFRPSNGSWHVTRSSDNSLLNVQFGQSGDVPVPSRYAPQ
jgi:hypothetical protein